MTVPGSTNPLLAYKSSAAAYTVSRSLRLNSADASYLSRTFGTPTTQGTFTFSVWVKRSRLGLNQRLFGASTNHFLQFDASDALNLTFAGVSRLTTTAFFRDAAAWYHVVWTQSGTSHTIYINGTSVGTATATSSVFNTAVAHQIGAANTANYFNGYLTEIHFIDGQALDPSSFAETNATTGQWVPRQFSGTYGTNGFKLTFSDNSNTTAATLGADTSGNGNNWTPNNFSVTAGVNNDSLVDTPTSYGTDTGVGGEVRGNYCTLNPLQNSTQHALSDGNLRITASTGGYGATAGTIGMSSGKWYWEQTLTAVLAQDINLGIGNRDTVLDNSYIGQTARSYGFSSNSRKWNGGVDSVYTTAWTNGNIIGLAFDADAGSLTLYKNGVSLGVAFSSIPADTYFPMAAAYSTASISNLNFGQRAFAYTAPSGFSPLVDTLLPTPTIAKPNTVMDTVLYTGTGASLTPTSTLGFSPDLVWIKSRSAATDHALYDTVRGVTKDIASNLTTAETTQAQGVTAFNSNGFTVGTLAKLNTNAATYVAWTWDAGSSNASNTSGSISSTVRANISAGFSIITLTTPASTGSYSVGHGLGIKPAFTIWKSRTTAGNYWFCQHQGLGNMVDYYIRLESTAAGAYSAGRWVNEPTSSLLYTNVGNTWNTSDNLVCYAWAPVAGYSAFGSYTGNGSTNGPFVYTGFRPAYVLIKGSSSITSWNIVDKQRLGYNADNYRLFAESSSAENATGILDFTANGFKIRNTGGDYNDNAQTYIYACFAESPLAYARAR